ncbi:magnesium transporter [Candidatus Peregrinibacteria bacterium]|nr:magnesium transporter [Candidatus Peregrinibacteria bacterium]
MGKKRIEYVDDDYESISTLVRLRFPSLIFGLVLGLGISLVTSRFEEVLSQNIHVAFFLPFIVYIADAIGSQTENIYSRDLKSGKARLSNYIWKEFTIGIIFGLVFGLTSAFVTSLWLGNRLLAYSVGLSAFLAIATAPLIALAVAQIFQSMRDDPAAGAGPIATVIQDMISVIIYGAVASAIML